MCFCCCFISVFKGAYTLFLLYYFFATLILMESRVTSNIFQKNEWDDVMRKLLSQKRLCKSFFWFDISWTLIRWNACEQFQTVKFKFAVSRPFTCYWGICFCFKVTDQIKYSINESLIILDIGQWILVLKSNVSLECTKYFRDSYYGYK